MLRITGKLTGAALAAYVLTAIPFIANARTWYVKQDGSGDAPTISAAVDSAVAGDTVLVAPGTYETGDINLKEGLIVTSETGAVSTKIIPKPYTYPLFLFYCENFHSYMRTEISGFWVEGFQYGWSGGGAIFINSCYEVYVENNVMTRNKGAISIEFAAVVGSTLYIQGNTFVSNIENAIYGGGSTHWGYIENNIIWDHCADIGIYLNLMCNCFIDLEDIPPSWRGVNFSLDPQFCGTSENGNLYLQSDSPCAPGNSPLGTWCDLIGALPVACGTAPTKKTTWGALKNIYR